MGLDSVELLVEFEKFFNIEVPDLEASKIYTIEDMVNTIAIHLGIDSEELDLQERVFLVFASTLKRLKQIANTIELSDKISDYLEPEEPQFILTLTDQIKLEAPMTKAYLRPHQSILNRFKMLAIWQPDYDWYTLTVQNYIDAICAKNYKVLLKRDELKTKYEIYIGIAGITSDTTGVDFFEIMPEKSFTKDLGID